MARWTLSLLAAAAISICAATLTAANKIVDLSNSNQIVFSNAFLTATVDVSGGAFISSLRGNFQGKYAYGNNVLTEGVGIRLERENEDGSITTAAGLGSRAAFTVDVNSDSCGQVTISGVVDDVSTPTASENWVLSLCQSDRSLKMVASGNTLESAYYTKLRSVRNAVYASPISTTGFYDQGVVQILAASVDNSHFASADRLQRVFFLGSTGSLDIQRTDATTGDLTVMLNSESGAVSGIPSFFSGFQDVLFGSIANQDLWLPGTNADDASVRKQSCHYFLDGKNIINSIFVVNRYWRPSHGRERSSCHQTIRTSLHRLFLPV
jgi:hypothetical protein